MEFISTLIPIVGMMYIAMSSFYVAKRGQFKISKRTNGKSKHKSRNFA